MILNKILLNINYNKQHSMKNILILLSFIAILTACNNSSNENQKETNNTEAELIALADFQNKGVNLLDTEIQIKGIVDHVCKHGGKKLVLVNDEARVHVLSEQRFDESIVGKEIIVNGIVKEEQTNEASLLKLEEDAINIHSENESDEIRQERMISYVNMMRDSLKKSNTDHFSEYHLEYISHKVVE